MHKGICGLLDTSTVQIRNTSWTISGTGSCFQKPDSPEKPCCNSKTLFPDLPIRTFPRRKKDTIGSLQNMLLEASYFVPV